MEASSRYFEDNLQRISTLEQPVEHNTNLGLLALSLEVAQLRSLLAQTNAIVAKLLQEPRSR